MKNKYMHTIDGRPAKYWKGQQISFLRSGDMLILANSLKQIREEQRASMAFRRRQKWWSTINSYGYIRIKV